MHLAADKVVARENRFYRLKHLASNMYLKQNGSETACTFDFRDPGTLFTFKHFSRAADPSQVLKTDNLFLKGKDGSYLCQVGADTNRHRSAHFVHSNMAPDAHALTIVNMPDVAVTPMTRLRRNVRVLQNFEFALQKVAELTSDKIPNRNEKRGPPQLPATGKGVLEIVDLFYEELDKALTMLVLNCSSTNDLRTRNNPLAKDGVPNRFVQKVLRELSVIPLVMHLMQDPFRRGLSENWLSEDQRYELTYMYTHMM